MKLFGNKSQEEIDQPEPNDVNAHIEITKRGKSRKVSARLISRADSSTLYKAEYETSKSDIFSYHTALEMLEKHAEYEGLEIVNKSTNVDIGYARTLAAKSSYGR